ncbi:hypothetical protein QAD02_006545 [Eretmocerus hayati]|uniref:Uncharacterized protein n=1 Tax=Eretmocerus hayati TaxID=131215 RepID=A0ACC2N192_9HYME|nr:hypothetical protein QAD02_006545 [Eretmocerus hayati]
MPRLIFTSFASKFTSLFRIFILVVILQLVKEVQLQQRQGVNARQQGPPILRLPNQGTLAGREVFISRTQRVVQYLGIPYAQPPIDQLRFAPPVTSPLPSWSGIRNASIFWPSCHQLTNRRKLHERLYLRLLPSDMPDPGHSEDCLFLNIFVPDGEF